MKEEITQSDITTLIHKLDAPVAKPKKQFCHCVNSTNLNEEIVRENRLFPQLNSCY